MILLTFNIVNIEAEVQNGFQVTDEERLKIAEDNTRAILRVLDIHDIKASFFVEVSLAEKLQNLIKAISSKGHEIAFIIKVQNRMKLKMPRRIFRIFWKSRSGESVRKM